MERVSRFRAAVLLLIFGFVLALFAFRLFIIQIVETNGNTDNTQGGGSQTEGGGTGDGE